MLLNDWLYRADEVRLEEIKHIYRRAQDGRRLLGVTETLKALGILPSFPMADREYHFWKGKATHRGIELLKANDLDWSTVDEEIKPRIHAYEKFVRETGYVSRFSELQVWNPTYLYCGCIDDLGYFPKMDALIDYKTGKVHAFTKLQTGAYSKCKLPPPLYGQGYTRFGLYLGPDGNYELTPPYRNPRDGDIFCSLVATLYWMMQEGLYRWDQEPKVRPTLGPPETAPLVQEPVTIAELNWI